MWKREKEKQINDKVSSFFLACVINLKALTSKIGTSFGLILPYLFRVKFHFWESILYTEILAHSNFLWKKDTFFIGKSLRYTNDILHTEKISQIYYCNRLSTSRFVCKMFFRSIFFRSYVPRFYVLYSFSKKMQFFFKKFKYRSSS